ADLEVGHVLVAVLHEVVGAAVLTQVARVVAGVEKGVLGEADVHERRLHPRQDVGDDPFVDVSHDGAPAFALHVQLGQEIPVLDGEAGLEDTGVDDDTLPHVTPRSGTRMPGGNGRVSGIAAFGSRAGVPAPSATPPWTIPRSSSAAAGCPRRARGPS